MNRKIGPWLFVNAMLLFGLLVACAAPTPQVIEKEVEVTVVTEKEVEVVVEKEVEVAVTVEVAKEVEVTSVPPPAAYHQSPMLDEMVASGELPPVEERLPVNPMVLAPRPELGETIGKYGGMLSAMAINPSAVDSFGGNWGEGGALGYSAGCAYKHLGDNKLYENICDWWELSDDFRTLTMHIREGIRWSDGEYLTTEDVRFWWEDVMLNEQVTSVIPNFYAPTGEPMQVIIDDEYTFRFVYPERYVAATDRLNGLNPWLPKHYLKSWHNAYNEDADALAQEEGFGEWWEAFMAHGGGDLEGFSTLAAYGHELPRMNRYIIGEADATGNRIHHRNPYYWKVDPEGNQLPYVDYYEIALVGSREVMEAKSVAGDYNFGGAWSDLTNYSLLVENAEQAGYTVRLYPGGMNWGGSITWSYNYTSKDPVLREIFNDLRWRQAMAYALDREEFNQIFNLGLSEPRQACVPATWSFADPSICYNYVDHDVDLANELLDEMGLEWDENNEWRLRPDGARLTLVTDIGQEGHRAGEFEFLVGEWAEVGVEVKWNQVEQSLYSERLLANDLDIGTWGAGGPDEATSHAIFPIRLVAPWHWRSCCALAGRDWYDWWESDGERGEEPPEIIRDLYDVLDEWQAEPLGTERYLELGHEMALMNSENIWWNMVVGPTPSISHAICATAVANEVQNMRDPEANGGFWEVDLLWLDE